MVSALKVLCLPFEVDKVSNMFDDMVALFKTLQLDDNDKKEYRYCEMQFDRADDNK